MRKIIKKIKILTIVVIAMPIIITALLSALCFIKRKKYLRCCKRPEHRIENGNDNGFEMM